MREKRGEAWSILSRARPQGRRQVDICNSIERTSYQHAHAIGPVCRAARATCQPCDFAGKTELGTGLTGVSKDRGSKVFVLFRRTEIEMAVY